MDRDAIARRLGGLGAFALLVGFLVVQASRQIFGEGWLPSWPEIVGMGTAALGLLLLVAALGAFVWARAAAP